MNRKAFEKLNYTLYVVGAAANGKRQGCIVNSLHQVASNFPPLFTVTINKSNETCAAVQAAGSFAATVLSKSCPKEIINQFGFKSGRLGDKFAAYDAKEDAAGNPYIEDSMVARISCTVVEQVEVGNYILFVGKATEAEVLQDESAMTVEDYLNIGKATPPAATVYRALAEDEGWVCPLCGYVYIGDTVPDGYKCPLCKCDGSKFTKK